MTDRLLPDGSQLLVGFGRDAAAVDADDRDAVQRALDRLVPGLEIIDATTHDWLADEFARGTWAIHRPGWYTRHHAAMRGPEHGLVFAGSDLADGWSGFVDGAIESGLRAAHQVQALLRPAPSSEKPAVAMTVLRVLPNVPSAMPIPTRRMPGVEDHRAVAGGAHPLADEGGGRAGRARRPRRSSRR